MFRRGSLAAAGLAFTGLAIAGVILPLVPTTPFLLLAVACFARSSPRLHRWLVSNRALGSCLEEWRLHKTVPRAAKRKAYLVVVLGFGVSLIVVEETGLRVALVVLGAGVLGFLAWLPTTREAKG